MNEIPEGAASGCPHSAELPPKLDSGGEVAGGQPASWAWGGPWVTALPPPHGGFGSTTGLPHFADLPQGWIQDVPAGPQGKAVFYSSPWG